MDQDKFDGLVRFEKLLHSFALIERIAHVTDREARENDVEHSYHMAMLAWYVIDAYKLPLNKDLVLRYALVHDLVEVYAGDTYIWDEEAKKTKHEREEKARVQIEEEFPEFPDLHETIKAYEAQGDKESVFVKALDKVQPVLANYIQEGRTWKEMKVGCEELFKHKREKVTACKEASDLLEEIFIRVSPEAARYFLKP